MVLPERVEPAAFGVQRPDLVDAVIVRQFDGGLEAVTGVRGHHLEVIGAGPSQHVPCDHLRVPFQSGIDRLATHSAQGSVADAPVVPSLVRADAALAERDLRRAGHSNAHRLRMRTTLPTRAPAQFELDLVAAWFEREAEMSPGVAHGPARDEAASGIEDLHGSVVARSGKHGLPG